MINLNDEKMQFLKKSTSKQLFMIWKNDHGATLHEKSKL